MATRTKSSPKGRPKAAKPAAKRPGAPRGRKRSRDGDTERRILDAARRVFIRRGSAGARMQEIAAEAAVNPALLHYYFRSKDALALAVFREAAAKLFPGVLRILSGTEPLEVRIERVVHHYIDTLRENPFLPGYVLAEINFDPGRIAALAIDAASPGQPSAPRQMLARLDAELAQHAAWGDLTPIRGEQFIVNLAAMCVFPFAARPMIAAILGIGAPQWDAFLDERRAELPRFILNAIRR